MAGVVKGSKHQRMVVVPYRPWLRAAVLVFICALVLVGGSVTYRLGFQNGAENHVALDLAYSQATAERDRISIELDELRSQFSVMDRTRLVDQQVNEQAQATIAELRGQIAALERDVLLYRQVMALENATAELAVESWELFETEIPMRYRYRLVVSQYGGGGASVEGWMEMALEGLQDENTAHIPFSAVSEHLGRDRIPISFRYLQAFEGDLVLPVDFEPQRIHIQLHAEQPTHRQLKRVIDWMLTGEN